MMDNKKLLLKKKRKKLSNSIFQKKFKASVNTDAFFVTRLKNPLIYLIY